MSRTEQTQHRHLVTAEQPRHLTRRGWGAAAVVVGVLLLLIPVLVVLAVTRTNRPPDTRSASVSQPAPARAAARPVLSKDCRTLLAAAQRMIGHADAVGQLRGHKQLMDDYKSGKIDRAAAFPQGSLWRQALARTLKDGVAAADRYDADKATYRKLAAQGSKGG